MWIDALMNTLAHCWQSQKLSQTAPSACASDISKESVESFPADMELFILQNHRMGMAGRDHSGVTRSNICAEAGSSWSTGHRSAPMWVLNISPEDHSTASLCRLFQGHTTLAVKNFFLIFILPSTELSGGQLFLYL